MTRMMLHSLMVGVLGLVSMGETTQAGKSDDPHRASLWVLDEEPSTYPFKDSIWLGYPSKKWVLEEKAAEALILKHRKERGLPSVVFLEELRFIARGHARDGAAHWSERHHLRPCGLGNNQ